MRDQTGASWKMRMARCMGGISCAVPNVQSRGPASIQMRSIFGRKLGPYGIQGAGELPVLRAIRTQPTGRDAGAGREQRRTEGRQHGAADPALRRLQMENPSQSQGRVEYVYGNGDPGWRYTRSGENPRNLNLGQRVLAVAVLGAAVVGSEQDVSGAARRERIDHIQHQAHIRVGVLD